MNDQIKEQLPKAEQSIINHPDMQKFIADRKINPEDFHLIEEASTFSRSFLVSKLHNVFSMAKDRSISELEQSIKFASTPDAKYLYTLMLEFNKKYDWSDCWNLTTILERIAPYQGIQDRDPGANKKSS